MHINLTTQPQIIQVESRPFLYREKLGPFMTQAPKAWQEFWSIAREVAKTLPISVMAGLSRIDESKPDDTRFIYQAGVFLTEQLTQVPTGLSVRTQTSGKYARFILTGAYSQLQHAYPQIFSILENEKIKLRDEFCAELYLNTPEDTAEENLKTEIIIPVQ